MTEVAAPAAGAGAGPVAIAVPTHVPQWLLPLLQTRLWQLLPRAQAAPPASVPGVKHDGRSDRSRSVHDNAATSETQAAMAATVRVDPSLKK